MEAQLWDKGRRIRLLVFDIDGTTYRNDIHDNPASTMDALRRMKKAGYKLAVCTSRSRDEMIHLAPAYLDLMDAVALVAGGIINYPDRTDVFYLDESEIAPGLALLDQYQAVYRWVDGQGRGYLNRHVDRYDNIFIRLYQMCPPLRVYDGSGMSHLLYYDIEPAQNQAVKNCFAGSQIVEFSPCHEITAPGVDKALTISKLAAHFGLTADQTAVFGDGGNDVGMLQKAGLGIAMGNGSTACKKAADYVTDRIENDGMYKACVEFGWLQPEKETSHG